MSGHTLGLMPCHVLITQRCEERGAGAPVSIQVQREKRIPYVVFLFFSFFPAEFLRSEVQSCYVETL